jgi:hypothetical protein
MIGSHHHFFYDRATRSPHPLPHCRKGKDPTNVVDYPLTANSVTTGTPEASTGSAVRWPKNGWVFKGKSEKPETRVIFPWDMEVSYGFLYNFPPIHWWTLGFRIFWGFIIIRVWAKSSRRPESFEPEIVCVQYEVSNFSGTQFWPTPISMNHDG